MCLVIDLYRHPTLKPFVAKYDIPVKKLLTKDRRGNYFTLYRGYSVIFSNGIATLEACLEKPKKVSIQGHFNYIINEGIHSWRSNPGCYIINNAIIPKGTLYYIGRDNDIVSEKLIIYE